MAIEIRKVDTADAVPTRAVVDEAFRAKGSVGTAEFLDALRNDSCIIGEWLAEEDGSVLAYIAFSRVWLKQVNSDPLAAAMLTPLAVRPCRQRRGIGLELTNHALDALEKRGETMFFVLGIPSYYPQAER